MAENLLLVGSMGAGKSTIGKLLSSRIGYAFVDTDNLVEERSGADIPWIFDVEGEAGFRQRETAALEGLANCEKTVVATGGGIVATPKNINLLRHLGKVIYLSASIDRLLERTSKDRKRPLLQVDDPRKTLESIVQQRDPLYRSVADIVIVTNDQATKHVVNQICKELSLEPV